VVTNALANKKSPRERSDGLNERLFESLFDMTTELIESRARATVAQRNGRKLN
jgi:hypothetical protein